MSEDLEFSVKQIVWASVNQYPPWPAKIVHKLHHNSKTVYKVHFFGDPTYSYLHSHSLHPFHGLDTEQLQPSEQNLKLKRAFELAKFSISKQFHEISHLKNDSILKPNSIPNLSTPFEQTCILSKNDIDLPLKTQQLSKNITLQTTFNDSVSDQIRPSNVLQLLNSYQKGQIAQQLGNLKRKQIICFQNHLKQNLLLKYKLHDIQFLKSTPKPQQTALHQLKDFRVAKIQKKKNQTPKFDQKEKCTRKIQKILHRKGMERHLSYKTTVKIMNEIQRRSSEGLKSLNSSGLREDSIRMMQQISLNMQQIQQMELEYIEKHILSFLDTEFQSHKLEEGSRMTQIYEEFAV